MIIAMNKIPLPQTVKNNKLSVLILDVYFFDKKNDPV